MVCRRVEIDLSMSKLSEPYDYEGKSFIDDMNQIYSKFRDEFLCKENRPTYKGKFIFFNMSKKARIKVNSILMEEELSKQERFYHIISLESKKKYIMYPCANDKAIECCSNDCTLSNALSEFKVLNRTECYYRLARINRIAEVINLANQNDENIEEWIEIEVDKKKNKVYKNFIRYKHKKDDFIVILREDRKRGQVCKYIFVTAFPLFEKENKKEYDKKYKKFIQKK